MTSHYESKNNQDLFDDRIVDYAVFINIKNKESLCNPTTA